MLLGLVLSPLVDEPDDDSQNADEKQQRYSVLQSNDKPPISIGTSSPTSRTDDSVFQAATRKVHQLLV